MIESKSKPATKSRKPRVINEDGALYKKRMREIKDLYAPQIENCSYCGSPRHHMYVCQYCGSGK